MYNSWEELENAIKDCKGCKLCNNRINIVFGTGNRNADVMFIGEGPGADEDRIRRTFCWKSRTTYERSFLCASVLKEKKYILLILLSVDHQGIEIQKMMKQQHV